MASMNQSARQRRLALVSTLSLMVAACGGGWVVPAPSSSSTPATPAATPPATPAATPPAPAPAPAAPAPAPTPAAPPPPTSNYYHTETYSTNTSIQTAQITAQGILGQAYVGPLIISNAVNGTLYYKPTTAAATALAYRFADVAGTIVAWAAQANSLGSQGYRFKSAYGTGYQYIKAANSSTTYVHKGRELVAGASITDFINALNYEGARGNRWLNILTLQAATVPVFVSETGVGPNADATYAYEFQAADSSVTSLMAKVNAMGEKGYQYLGTFTWSGKSYRLFELSSAQAGPISYTFEQAATTDTLKSVADTMTANAVNGALYWGEVSPLGELTTSASASGGYRVYVKGAQSLIGANGILMP